MGGLVALTPETVVPIINEILRSSKSLKIHENFFIQLIDVARKEVEGTLSHIIIKILYLSFYAFLDTVNKIWAAMHDTDFDIDG